MITMTRNAAFIPDSARVAEPTCLDDDVMDARLDCGVIASRGVPAARKAPLRVLIADDCRDATDSLSMLMRLWGHEVHTAYSGLAALELAVAKQPDVLLLDLAMPQMNGYEVARQVRRHAILDHSLLVAVTGYPDQPHRRLGFAAGFDWYLVKPVEPTVVEQLLRQEKTRRAMA